VPLSETTFHHGSHEHLLSRVETAPTDSGVDAIIVPTVRRPANLAEASVLALALGSTLVTLHSGTLTTAAAVVNGMPEEIGFVAIDIPRLARLGPVHSSCQLRLPRWETSELLEGTRFARRTDLSLKRNLALMLSHMAGWSRILFLDDDIIQIDPDDVRRASSLLGRFSAVGLRLRGPVLDHSVVCEAYRRLGGKQDSFVGGGALAIESSIGFSRRAFFPDVYNDDWFFLLDGENGLQATGVVESVTQLPYDPFRTPQRAIDQELGDVLAEGVYWLLDQDRPIRDANEEHWRTFLKRRHVFISRVLEMVDTSDLRADEKERMTAALRGALNRLASIEPAFCERYLHAWSRDREKWRHHLDQLPVDIPPAAALDMLTEPGSPRLTWHTRAPGKAINA
jgi:hypothetical protein